MRQACDTTQQTFPSRKTYSGHSLLDPRAAADASHVVWNLNQPDIVGAKH